MAFCLGLGALVVMGGTMNVDELDEYPFLERSRSLMENALESDLPTLGVCLGSQMMARVLGAEVQRAGARNAFFSPLELTDEGFTDPLLAPFAGEVEVLQFHEDTFTVPDDAVQLATSRASGLAQAFRHGDNAYAVQFHFEVDSDIVRGWLEDIGPDEMVSQWNRPDAGRSLLNPDAFEVDQEVAGAELVRDFLEVHPLASPASEPSLSIPVTLR